MTDNVTFLVHGINTGDKGSSTVMQVAPHIAPYSRVANHSYGRIGPIGAHFKNKKIAKGLTKCTRKASRACENHYAIGHSNGCAIIVEALRQGAKFKGILLINPALNINTKFPPGDYTITVIHTKHDKAVRAARFFDSLPLLEMFVPDIWGAMGAKGYVGPDPRPLNLCWDFLKGHSAIFDEEVMNMVGPQLAMQLYPEAVCV
jgi:hypothetical protein